MLDTGILAAILLVSAFLLLLAVWKLWHVWRQHRGDKTPNGATEPLVGGGLPASGTLKRGQLLKLHHEDNNLSSKASQVSDRVFVSDGRCRPNANSQIRPQRSTITLEVVSGPSTGTFVTLSSGQSITVGRIPQNNLVLDDPEVSGKHAYIKWNTQRSAWELVDMGSLNGTLLNHQPISFDQAHDAVSRKPGVPVELASGDIVSLGSTSEVLVQICYNGNGSFTPLVHGPLEVGVATDPMTLHRGGKELSMEDVCYWEWPLQGLQEFGAFCIFDGHGGAGAAEAASKILPQKLSDMLRVDAKRAELLNNVDATDVLKAAFSATEEVLDHEYEGCTATVLLLWMDFNGTIYAQCANVGDSACIFSIEGKYVNMTEDHRLTSLTERSRMLQMGKQLHAGETRLCGMNIARVLGDKFLKAQDARFSSEPFVSEVLRVSKESKALAVLASDGLWDVLSQRRALQLALEARAGQMGMESLSAHGIAQMLVNKARMLRTKDNTSVMVLNFVSDSKPSYNTI